MNPPFLKTLASARRRPHFAWCAGTAALSSLALTACTTGPVWHRPALPQQRTYVAGRAATATSSAPGAANGAAQVFERGKVLNKDWYRMFGSPVLDQLIQQALAANPTRAAARSSVAAAREAVAVVAGGRYPSVSLSAFASRNRASGVLFGIRSPAFVNTFNLYQAQLSASYNLDLAGAMAHRIEDRKALARVARARLLDTNVTLVNNVIASALAEAAARTTLRSVREIVARERMSAALVQDQVRYGMAMESDLLRARARLDDTEALIPDLEQQISVARHRLAILTGTAPAVFRDPRLMLSDFKLPTKLPVSLPSQLVQRRPDIIAAENLVHAALARLGLADAQLLPQVELTAGYGRIGLQPRDLVNPAAEIFDFGAGLVAPLFEGGTLRAKKRQAYDEYQVALADYKRTVLHAFDQVADSLRALQHDATRLAARARARAEARQALTLVEAQQQQGSADALDLYLAQIELQHAEIDYNRARLARLADTATLARALGGGWRHRGSTASVIHSPSKIPAGSS